jgi:hypothetical protein
MLFYGALAFLAATLGASVVLPSLVGGAWSPTPMHVVETMLDRAEVGRFEVLYDLGAGDGRTVLQAAKRGAICYAVEVDPLKSWLIGWRARRGAVHGQVRILRENFFHTNLRKADVITAYLSPAAMEKLAPKLLAELKPGARVVSYRRPIPGWLPESVGGGIYTYRMPQGKDGRL